MAHRSKSVKEPRRDGRPAAASDHTQKASGAIYAIAVVALLALTTLVYAPTARFGLVSLDDPIYTGKPMDEGLTLENIRWAFSEVYWGLYAPVTLLSHMADRELFGDWAGGYHLVNLGLHLANTVLLLLIFWRATKARWESLFVAGLFAVHPLHVEAVAWVAERKEILCTSFMFLALFAYVRYCEKPSAQKYAAVFLFFTLALLSKAMAITFPFLLLLLDYWPLERVDFLGGAARGFKTLGRLFLEKIPLFALLPIVAWLTVTAQGQASAIAPDQRLPLDERLANACLAYGRYVMDTVAPSHLAAYYVHPQGRYSVPLVLLSALFLAAATAAVLMLGKRLKYLPFGWLWFVGTLVPVIGIVQVGLQSSADRYTYVPLVGLFVAIAWGTRDLIALRPPRRSWLLSSAGCLALLAFAVLARQQVLTWSSSEVLYRRILRYSPQCALALINLGAELGDQRRFAEAADCFQQASRFTRIPPAPKFNWCFCLAQLERNESAAACFQEALAQDPGAGQAYFQYAFTLSKLQRHEEAIINYRKAYALKAIPAGAIVKIGEAYRTSGLPEEAARVYRIVLDTEPGDRAALAGLAACGLGPSPETSPIGRTPRK